ncbi:hypothetical protein [Parasitella parasitica]|uniref:Uncharacterized protein n=1 Tax=Parasitella parasitica TaxID=35722 RepID=A0A0B7N376_9FUNG|nr:hypothetical protein [Parasitella parasitica]
MQTQYDTKSSACPGSSTSRQQDGLSQPQAFLFDSMNENELKTQCEKINAMLNDPNLKLPDGGRKLKIKLEQLKALLDAQQTNANAIIDSVSALSLYEKPSARKAIVLQSSQPHASSKNLLRAHPLSNNRNTTAKIPHSTQMISLEESMRLQEAQQKDIKLANMKKKLQSVQGSSTSNRRRTSESLASDLSLTMNRLQLDPETRPPRPDDDNPEDMEGEDADSDEYTTDSDEDDDFDDMDIYDRYEDEGYEEYDQHVFEDGQQHNNNNARHI